MTSTLIWICIALVGVAAGQSQGPRIATENGDIILNTGFDGRIGYRQGNAQPEYLNETATKAIDAAANMIKVGFEIGKEMAQTLNFQTQLGDAATARAEIRGEVNGIRDEVAATILAANVSLNAVSASLQAVVGQMTDCAAQGAILGADNVCVNPMPTCPELVIDPPLLMDGFLRGDAVEAVAGAQETVVCPRPGTGPVPGVIQCLRTGQWSNTSAVCQNCSSISTGNQYTTCSECFNGVCLRQSVPGRTADAPARDCQEIKLIMGNAANDGLYWIGRGRGSVWQAFCANSVQNGGWTLVASIHEDNVQSRDPDNADRWTSQGNGIGSRAWQDTSTFGDVTAAATSDYKSEGYTRTNASNIMFWHVANGSPMSSYKANARYRYFTNNNMLRSRPGRTFAGIFAGAQAIVTSDRSCNGRLRTAIVWDTQNTRGDFYDNQISPHFRGSHMGRDQMDFSSGTDSHCSTCIFAMCPGVSCSRGCANHEHACVGGAMPLNIFASDFTAQGWDGTRCPSCDGSGWSSGGRYIRSAIFMFVR